MGEMYFSVAVGGGGVEVEGNDYPNLEPRVGYFKWSKKIVDPNIVLRGIC